jgi:GH25 family lysozyme M1 (1,4-beta-N-acetylmuramidase)
MKKGIDVSEHQGIIDWKKVKDDGIEFAILRVGYAVTLDKQFLNNVKGCQDNNIPFGVYLFSYATDVNEAVAEAKFVLEKIKDFEVEYPVIFDYEYDSVRYFEKINKSKPSNELINQMASAFLLEIEKAGYYAMNYMNKDYYNHVFNDYIKTTFDNWIAVWGVGEAFTTPNLWQYSSTGKVNGINGNVDMNYCYRDYPELIKSMGLNKLKGNDWDSMYKELDKSYQQFIHDLEVLIDLYK